MTLTMEDVTTQTFQGYAGCGVLFRHTIAFLGGYRPLKKVEVESSTAMRDRG